MVWRRVTRQSPRSSRSLQHAWCASRITRQIHAPAARSQHSQPRTTSVDLWPVASGQWTGLWTQIAPAPVAGGRWRRSEADGADGGVWLVARGPWLVAERQRRRQRYCGGGNVTAVADRSSVAQKGGRTHGRTKQRPHGSIIVRPQSVCFAVCRTGRDMSLRAAIATFAALDLARSGPSPNSQLTHTVDMVFGHAIFIVPRWSCLGFAMLFQNRCVPVATGRWSAWRQGGDTPRTRHRTIRFSLFVPAASDGGEREQWPIVVTILVDPLSIPWHEGSTCHHRRYLSISLRFCRRRRRWGQVYKCAELFDSLMPQVEAKTPATDPPRARTTSRLCALPVVSPRSSLDAGRVVDLANSPPRSSISSIFQVPHATKTLLCLPRLALVSGDYGPPANLPSPPPRRPACRSPHDVARRQTSREIVVS